MLPSPSKLRHHDLSKPIKARQPHHQKHNPKNLPFTPPPSRLVLHKCPEVPNQPTPPQKPLTSLILSLPLAQKIHQLILASRQIESLARALFSGYFSEGDVAKEMEVLEDQYDDLREDVECELETAWVNAGFLPASMPTFPAVAPMQKAGATNKKKDWTNDTYTVDRDLKRKREEDDENLRKKDKKRNKKRKQRYSSGSDSPAGWTQSPPLQPVGVQQAMIPLHYAQEKKMKTWRMDRAWGTKRCNVSEDISVVSPRGTVFVV